MDLDTLISQQNPQWIDRNYLPIESNWLRRKVFVEIRNWFNKRFIIALTGLRRVGKSTVLKQLIADLIKQGKGKNCFYFSFEKIQEKRNPEFLSKAIQFYLNAVLLKNPYEIKEKVYFFLDEIQNIPHWQEVIKFFYDQNENLKFFVSGSNSLFINKKSKESLGGRIIEIKIYPLKFKEYLEFKKPNFRILADNRTWLLSNLPIINTLFEEYLRQGQFPEVISEKLNQSQAKVYLESIEEKITQQDLPKIFPIEYPEVFSAIINQIKKSPGQRIEYQSIAKDVGLDKRTLSKYFDYLEKGFLISLCYNFGKKPIKAPRIAKKAYLVSPNFAQGSNRSILVENYIFNHLQQRFLQVYFQKDKEIDFVAVDKNQDIYLFEVKFQNEIKTNDTKNLKDFIQTRKTKKAILITKKDYQKKTNIFYLPASLIEFYEL